MRSKYIVASVMPKTAFAGYGTVKAQPDSTINAPAFVERMSLSHSQILLFAYTSRVKLHHEW